MSLLAFVTDELLLPEVFFKLCSCPVGIQVLVNYLVVYFSKIFAKMAFNRLVCNFPKLPFKRPFKREYGVWEDVCEDKADSCLVCFEVLNTLPESGRIHTTFYAASALF